MSLDVFPRSDEEYSHHAQGEQLREGQDDNDRMVAPDRGSGDRLGHSRVAASVLDGHIPTKRPRLGPMDSPVRSLYRNNSNDELSPTATANQLFFSPPSSQGMVLLERSPHFFDEANTSTNSLAFHLERDENNNNTDDTNDDDNSSSGWSLRPLAPESATPCFAAGNSGNDHEGSLSSGSYRSNQDRWRTNQPMSSFSSTLTERSTAGSASGETEDSPFTTITIEPSPQQMEIQYNSTSNSDEGRSKRKSQKPTQTDSTNNDNPPETVDQLSARLDHWCSITNMRALKRRNNIYAEHSKSAQYNPNQEYDYSHYQLSRHVRKLQCQNAKQEVMRALRNAGNTGGENADLFDGDEENNYPFSMDATTAASHQSSPSNNSNNNNNNNTSPSTPTISNATPRYIHTSTAAAAAAVASMDSMDAFMGE